MAVKRETKKNTRKSATERFTTSGLGRFVNIDEIEFANKPISVAKSKPKKK